jgi:hypothetical protein
MTSTRSPLTAAVLCCLIPAAAGCSSGGAGAAAPTAAPSPGLHALAAEYLAIAEPANHRLDVEVSAYADHAHHNLAAAEHALRAEAATERSFDRQLAAIAFPPAIEATARALIRVNEIRARLALRQAAASSLPALRSFTAGHRAADAEVEAQVRVIRTELGLPPPAAS